MAQQQLFLGQLGVGTRQKCCAPRQAGKLQQRRLPCRRAPRAAGELSAPGPQDDTSLVPAQQQQQQGVAPEVAEALARVQEAMAEAESTLDKLHTLPSAREPTQLELLVDAAKPALGVLALLAVCFVTHSFGWAVRVMGSLLMALAMGLGGYRKGSLSPSGAVAAVLVGCGTLGPSFRAGLTLLTFFYTSSKLTQLGDELKAVDEDHKAGGQRDWKQVACNALVPTVLALAAAVLTGAVDAPLHAATAAGRLPAALTGAFLCYYACCCGDTWASELGQLSEQQPRLITTLRPVRKGTNGGVTLLGLAASVAGGLCMGLTFWLAGVASPTGAGKAALQQWRLVPLGLAAGLIGSLIDSLLGATIQFTGYNIKTGKVTSRPGPEVAPISGFPLLTNNAVNIVSASLTALLGGFACLRLFS